MNRSPFRLAFLLTALLAVGLVGCSDDDDVLAPTPDDSRLRVVHASPDAPAVDVYALGVTMPLIEDLAYGETSAYLDLAPGDYVIELRPAGADPMSDHVFATGFVVGEGETITAVAAGLFGSDDAGDNFRILVFVEDFADPGAGMAAVRIVHASADAPLVALDVANDGAPEVTGFARFAETGPAGVALPAGEAIRVGVWAGDPLSRAAVFTTPALPEGGELFVIATGLLGGSEMDGDAFNLLAVTPAGTLGFIAPDAPAMVYALHASPDAPAVDIDADGATVVTNLAFGELSGGLSVMPGAYALDFRATGDTDVAASATTPYLEPGTSYLAVASGFLTGAPAFTLLPLADGLPRGDEDAYVRVLHASPDAPPVDVGTVDMGVVTAIPGWTGLGFGDATASGGTLVPVADLTIGVAGEGTTDPVATFDLSLTEGLRTFAVAAGSLLGDGESFRLILVVTGDLGWQALEVMPN